MATLDLAEGGPAGALGLTGDVRDSEEIDAAVERAETELGPLDSWSAPPGSPATRSRPWR